MIISVKPVTKALLILLVLAGCDATENTSQAKRNNTMHQVEVLAATMQQVSHQQTITGTLEAATIVHLHNEVSGRIIALPLYEGDNVTQGTAIIELDDDLVEAELAKTSALKKQASLDLDRLKKLIPKKLASEEDLTRARTELEIASAEEKLQRTLLSKTVILAPFSGIITERNYEPGDIVPQYSHILTLIDPASLHIKMQLSESWLSLIDQNSDVEISIDALGNTVHKGSITRTHPTIDPDTRKGIVEVSLNPQPAGAMAGQLVRVKINSTAKDRLLVPAHAVRHDSEGAHVFVVDDNNKVIKTYIKKGLQFGNQMEITDGLLDRQNVIVKGFTALRDGSSVEIVEHNKDIP